MGKASSAGFARGSGGSQSPVGTPAPSWGALIRPLGALRPFLDEEPPSPASCPLLAAWKTHPVTASTPRAPSSDLLLFPCNVVVPGESLTP